LQRCGLDEQGNDTVLLSTNAPALENHDKYTMDSTPVTIIKKKVHSLNQVSDGNSLEISFYNVSLPDSEQAWVAGWCLEN